MEVPPAGSFEVHLQGTIDAHVDLDGYDLAHVPAREGMDELLIGEAPHLMMGGPVPTGHQRPPDSALELSPVLLDEFPRGALVEVEPELVDHLVDSLADHHHPGDLRFRVENPPVGIPQVHAQPQEVVGAEIVVLTDLLGADVKALAEP